MTRQLRNGVEERHLLVVEAYKLSRLIIIDRTKDIIARAILSQIELANVTTSDITAQS
jgi:hypothetical protein